MWGVTCASCLMQYHKHRKPHSERKRGRKPSNALTTWPDRFSLFTDELMRRKAASEIDSVGVHINQIEQIQLLSEKKRS